MGVAPLSLTATVALIRHSRELSQPCTKRVSGDLNTVGLCPCGFEFSPGLKCGERSIFFLSRFVVPYWGSAHKLAHGLPTKECAVPVCGPGTYLARWLR